MNIRITVFQDYPTLCFTSVSFVLSFLAFRPSPSAVPIVLVLTTLLIYSRRLCHADQAFLRTCLLILAMAIAGTVSRLKPSLSALSTPGVSICILFLSMVITSALTIAVVYLDNHLFTRIPKAWSQVTLFPALWATLWAVVSFTSPLGRLSTWSPTGNGTYSWMLPYFGPVGIDWVVAAWAVVLSQAVGAWYMGEQEEDVPWTSHTAPAAEQPRQLSTNRSTLFLAVLVVLLTVPSFLCNTFPLSLVPPVTTPFSVGCVLPDYQGYKHHSLTLDDYIKESQKLTSQARVLLWPEGAVKFNSEMERTEGLAKIKNVTTGSVVGVSFEEVFRNPADNRTSSRRTGIAIISQESDTPHQIYYKRRLVPIAESYSLSDSKIPPTVTTIQLKHPKDVNRTDWADGPHHTRPITLTASICLDFADPALFADLPSRPALVLGPANTWDIDIGNAMWHQVKQRAEELGTMILWCDGGKGGVSGVVGRGYRDFMQVGPRSWVRTISIQYPFNDARTPFAYIGHFTIFLAWLIVVGDTFLERVSFGKPKLKSLSSVIRILRRSPREEVRLIDT